MTKSICEKKRNRFFENADFENASMKFLWTIKGNKKKKLFLQAVSFYILFH